MKKTILTVFVLLISLVFVYGTADAITGQCSNCHTMHNSQNGDAMGESSTPQAQLLRASCVACHTTSTGITSSYGAPAVLHTDNPSGQGYQKTNAGGDFYWVNLEEVTNATKGHNVIELPGVTKKDDNFSNFTPPGWDENATSGFGFGQVAGGNSSWNSQLTCAGKHGCHGDHSEDTSFGGIRGAHHSNPSLTATVADTADTVGNSYRFLGGIKGMEHPTWNWNESATSHNEYYGENNTSDRSSGANYGSKDTISFLCGECHGLFHATIDENSTSGSPWVRHPTDIYLPDSGEYNDYNSDDDTENGTGDYSLEAPVARSTVPSSSSSTVTPDSDVIMCLSCHRAHGSPQPDLLRWVYTDMVAGGGNTNGCFTCHTGKN